MRTSGVVPQQPIDQFLIKLFNIVGEQHSVSCNERIGERTVESFDLRILLWTPRVGVEMNDVAFLKIYFKMFGELAAVIGLYVGERYGSDRLELLHEVGGRVGRMILVRAGEGKLGFNINGSDDVSLDAVSEANDRISFD